MQYPFRRSDLSIHGTRLAIILELIFRIGPPPSHPYLLKPPQVQELGGPDALLSNPEAYRRFLSDSLALPDQLILAELDLGCHRALEHSEVRHMWRCYIGSSAVWVRGGGEGGCLIRS